MKNYVIVYVKRNGKAQKDKEYYIDRQAASDTALVALIQNHNFVGFYIEETIKPAE